MSLLLALTVLADAPLAVPACPIDRVVYRLQGAPQFEAGFARTLHPYSATTDLFFFLKTPRRTYWFDFAVSQGHSSIAIVPAFDPHHDTSDDPPPPGRAGDPPPAIAFTAFGPDLAPYDHPPRSNDPPPARLFSAGLDGELYYGSVALAGGDPAAVQEDMPEAMFVPAGCAARPH